MVDVFVREVWTGRAGCYLGGPHRQVKREEGLRRRYVLLRESKRRTSTRDRTGTPSPGIYFPLPNVTSDENRSDNGGFWLCGCRKEESEVFKPTARRLVDIGKDQKKAKKGSARRAGGCLQSQNRRARPC